MNSILNAIVDNKRREVEAKAMLGIYDKALSHATKSVSHGIDEPQHHR